MNSRVAETIFNTTKLHAAQSDLRLISFGSFGQWNAWKNDNGWAFDQSYIKSVAIHAKERGVKSVWLGEIAASDVTLLGAGRTVIAVHNLAERNRAMLDLIASMPAASDVTKIRIYAAEGESAMAMALRARFPRFLGSGYRPGLDGSDYLFPIPHQDLTALTFPDSVFDVALTEEVLEHVSDLPAALRELARILRPGGVMMSTFPFLWESSETQVRARLEDNKIEHLVAPEYHSDPHNSDGVLVFQLPGWDVIDLARASGFTNAEFLFYASKLGGIVAPHLAGVWIFLCTK